MNAVAVRETIMLHKAGNTLLQTLVPYVLMTQSAAGFNELLMN
jgi:hypothetical protein